MEPTSPLCRKSISQALYEQIQHINRVYIGEILNAFDSGNGLKAHELNNKRETELMEAITAAFKHVQDIIDYQQRLITSMTHTQIRDIRNHYTVSLGEQPDTPIDPLQGTASTDPYAYDLKKQSEDL